MSDENQGPLTSGAISLSTKAARTSLPQVAPKTRVFLKLNQAPVISTTDKGQIVRFRWELSQPTISNEGQPINPGTPGSIFMQTVFMYAGEGKDQTHFLPTLARIVNALFGTVSEGDTNPKGKQLAPELIAPGSTLGNVQFDQQVVASMLGKEITTVMVADRRPDHAGEVELGRPEYPGDVKA